LRSALADRLREHVATRYSATVIMKRLEHMYDALLSSCFGEGDA
jgi:hypothetical protein